MIRNPTQKCGRAYCRHRKDDHIVEGARDTSCFIIIGESPAGISVGCLCRSFLAPKKRKVRG
jgi:hypothetical protein